MPERPANGDLNDIRAINDDFEIRVIDSVVERNEALEIEASIFAENGFVSMDEYLPFLLQSVFFGAFSKADELIGMVRLILGQPLLPPLLAHHVEIDGDRAHWETLAKQGRLLEWGTYAIRPDARDKPLWMDISRVTYRYARSLGITHFGMVTEPKRAALINRAYQFRFKRIGPDQFYMGEDVHTAPWILDAVELEGVLAETNPRYLEWLTVSQMTEPRYLPHRTNSGTR